MSFINEYRALIKNLYQFKRYGHEGCWRNFQK